MYRSVGETYQVADDLSYKIIIAHDVILRCLTIGNICQNAQCLGIKRTNTSIASIDKNMFIKNNRH